MQRKSADRVARQRLCELPATVPLQLVCDPSRYLDFSAWFTLTVTLLCVQINGLQPRAGAFGVSGQAIRVDL